MNNFQIIRPNHSPETGIARPSLHWPDCAAWAVENPGRWLAQTHSGFAAGCMPCDVFDTEAEAIAAIIESDAKAVLPGPQHPSYWSYYSAPGGDPRLRIMSSDSILEMLKGAAIALK